MALYPCAVSVCVSKALVGPLDADTICRGCGERFCGLHFDDPFQHNCARKTSARLIELKYLQHSFLVSARRIAQMRRLTQSRQQRSRDSWTFPHILPKPWPGDQVTLA